jgi:predicted GNAT superfamily acetyltransferase
MSIDLVMVTPEIHDLTPADIQGSLALNNQHAKETSHLTEVSFASLLREAFYARGIDGGRAALLIALDQDATYDSPNFLWFKTRLSRFVYVDRVIVATTARRQGFAQCLYRDLFGHARIAGHDRVVCEVSVIPANLKSVAFHASLKFQAVGEATLSFDKRVRYYEKLLV